MVPQTTSSRTSARGCVIRRTSRGSSIVAKCSSRTASRDLSDSAAAADDMRGLRIEEPHGINPECACHPLSHEFGALGLTGLTLTMLRRKSRTGGDYGVTSLPLGAAG